MSDIDGLAVRHETRLQGEYYAHTAHHYDDLHGDENDEHGVALRFLSAMIREFDLRSMLDVGTGTGRVPAFLEHACPNAIVTGVEPVLALLGRAREKTGDASVRLASASGYRLPFADASFDGVCQFGVLHHVKRPDTMVREMTRVARKAVFLSDSNRFGQGSLPARLLKLALAKGGLWPLANLVKTRGKGYTISAGDGLSYSYSVFDSLQTLHGWADRVVLLPTGRSRDRGWLIPLLTSSHVLVCAFRDW